MPCQIQRYCFSGDNDEYRRWRTDTLNQASLPIPEFIGGKEKFIMTLRAFNESDTSSADLPVHNFIVGPTYGGKINILPNEKSRPGSL